MTIQHPAAPGVFPGRLDASIAQAAQIASAVMAAATALRSW